MPGQGLFLCSFHIFILIAMTKSLNYHQSSDFIFIFLTAIDEDRGLETSFKFSGTTSHDG